MLHVYMSRLSYSGFSGSILMFFHINEVLVVNKNKNPLYVWGLDRKSDPRDIEKDLIPEKNSDTNSKNSTTSWISHEYTIREYEILM